MPDFIEDRPALECRLRTLRQVYRDALRQLWSYRQKHPSDHTGLALLEAQANELHQRIRALRERLCAG